MENEKNVDVIVEKENTPQNKIKDTEKEPKKPLRVRVGEWLIADHPKLKKATRIGAGVVGGLAVVGAAALAYFHGHDEAADKALDSLNEIDPADAPFELTDGVSEIESLTE
jgi:hypothetical protein